MAAEATRAVGEWEKKSSSGIIFRIAADIREFSARHYENRRSNLQVISWENKWIPRNGKLTNIPVNAPGDLRFLELVALFLI